MGACVHIDLQFASHLETLLQLLRVLVCLQADLHGPLQCALPDSFQLGERRIYRLHIL